MLTFNMTKRPYHPFAEQFAYFQDQNEFKIGYQIESYPKRMANMDLFESTTFGTHYRHAKNQQGYFLS